MNIFFVFLSVVFGAAFGSFLCNWMDREERLDLHFSLGDFFGGAEGGTYFLEVFGGRSECVDCGVQLKVFDLVPVLSFIFLKGRCRNCGVEIPERVLIVEIAGAAVCGFALFLSMALGASYAHAVAGAVFALFLMTFFFFDYFYGVLPDVVAFVGTILFLIFAWFGPGAAGRAGLMDAGLAAAVGFLFFAFQNFVSGGRAVGMGDAYAGLFLGAALGFKKLVIALLLSYVLGAIVSVALIALKIKKRSDTVPFASFLAVGGLIAWFAGPIILRWVGV